LARVDNSLQLRFGFKSLLHLAAQSVFPAGRFQFEFHLASSANETNRAVTERTGVNAVERNRERVPGAIRRRRRRRRRRC
jgi:hypothetical protein